MAAEALRCEAGPSRTICAVLAHAISGAISPILVDLVRKVSGWFDSRGQKTPVVCLLVGVVDFDFDFVADGLLDLGD